MLCLVLGLGLGFRATYSPWSGWFLGLVSVRLIDHIYKHRQRRQCDDSISQARNRAEQLRDFPNRANPRRKHAFILRAVGRFWGRSATAQWGNPVFGNHLFRARCVLLFLCEMKIFCQKFNVRKILHHFEIFFEEVF